MDIITIILQQLATMIILAGIGYLMFRAGKITPAGSKVLANILIYLSMPCVIVKGFLVERTAELVMSLLCSALAAIVLLFVSIVISRLLFKKDGIAVFATAFSNAGFFGAPLIVACLGDGAVFYIASFIAFLNLLQWTYGVAVMTAEDRGDGRKDLLGTLSFKKVITAPFMIAILIGLALFLTGFQMPEIICRSVNLLAGLNTPLAMFTVGVYLAEADIRKMLRKPVLYGISAARLLLIPVVSLLLLSLLPADMQELKLAILIAAACPVGANVAIYAQLHDRDYIYSVETVVVSSILSIATLPVVVWLATLIWR